MANRADPGAKSIHGTNPQNLVEKILRSKIVMHVTKIYQNTYWEEQCFGLTAETLVDEAMELDHLGGTYGGNRKPTPFMCLVMKMLQIHLGGRTLTHVDEVIDELLTKDHSCDIALPPVQKRWTLEASRTLEPRRSALEDDFEEEEEKEEDNQAIAALEAEKDYHCGQSPMRERDMDRKCDSHKLYRDRDRDYGRNEGEGGEELEAEIETGTGIVFA